MENLQQILQVLDSGGSFALLVVIAIFFYNENKKLRADLDMLSKQNKELEITIARVEGKQDLADAILLKLAHIESKL
jgi:hypothetical protein